MDDWLKYAPSESLALFMYQKPRAAKKLHFDVIPRTVDDYLTHLAKVPDQDLAARLNNPVWHIHDGDAAARGRAAVVRHSAEPGRGVPCRGPGRPVALHRPLCPRRDARNGALLDRLVHHAIATTGISCGPRSATAPPPRRRRARWNNCAPPWPAPPHAEAEDLQTLVYEVGKAHAETFPSLRDWFKALYQILLGQDQGPRMGSFIALFGRAESLALIDRALAGEDLSQDPPATEPPDQT